MAKKQGKRSKGASPTSSKANRGGGKSQAAQPVAALYHLDAGTERGDAVRAVLIEQGIRVKTVSIDDLSSPVGAIAGLIGFKKTSRPYAGDIPETEFMLLNNVTGKRLDELLAAMRAANASVGCKAQVTQFNRLWPFATLVNEVVKEHATMSGEANQASG